MSNKKNNFNILKVVYGKDIEEIKNFKYAPTLFGLFDTDFKNDEKAIELKKRINKKPSIENHYTQLIFWVRLFQILYNNDENDEKFIKINDGNGNVDQTDEIDDGIDKYVIKINGNKIHEWKEKYKNESEINNKNESDTPIGLFKKINEEYPSYKLSHNKLSLRIKEIYKHNSISTLQECDDSGNAILKEFKDEYLKIQKGQNEDEKKELSDLIDDFALAFVNNIRQEIGLQTEEQKIYNAIGINNDTIAQCKSEEKIKEKLKKNTKHPRINRFKYTSDTIEFVGRDVQLKILEKMCENEEVFLWTGITGRGGIGKTRLAYEFCKSVGAVNGKGWYTIKPHHSKPLLNEIIKEVDECLGKGQEDKHQILICFDYVKYNIEVIKEILYRLIEKSENLSPQLEDKVKIRVILIERNAEDIDLSDDYLIEDYRYALEDYDGRKFINLGELNDKVDYYKIIKQYIEENTDSNEKIILDKENFDQIWNEFETYDEFKRPLFAMFAAEAWISRYDDNSKFDFKDIAAYFLKREQSRIKEILKEYVPDKVRVEKYYNAIIYIMTLSTYLGGINLSEHSEVIKKETGIDISDQYLLKVLSEIDYISDGNVIAIEPDVIGEFATIDFFNNYRTSIPGFVEYIVNYDFYAFLSHTNKMYEDYEDIIDSSEWRMCVKCINFPRSMNYIRYKLFSNNKFIEEVVLHGQVYGIQESAFMNAVNLRKVHIPSSVEYIDKFSFKGCEKLEEIIYENERCKTISLVKIEDSAFQGCKALVRFIIPESLQHIGKSAFRGCEKLEQIVIPRKIQNIPNGCFDGCKRLSYCKLPANLISIGSAAFRGCEELEQIVIPKKIQNIPNGCFDSCKRLSYCELPADLISIGSSAFRECEELEEISLPSKLEELKNGCFAECSKLQTVSISEKSSLKIGIECFKNCKSLIQINLENISYIGDFAFLNCEKISSIVIKNKNSKICRGAFKGCASLINADICNVGSKIIPEHLFANCVALKEVKLSKLVCKIEREAFKGCSSLERVDLPYKLTDIEEGVFNGCSNLKNIKFYKSLKRIRSKAFLGCKNIDFRCFRALPIKNMTEICGFSFSSINKGIINLITLDQNVVHVDIPSNVTSIKDNVFMNFTQLKKVKAWGRIEFVGENAFRGCVELKSIDFGNSIVKTIKKGAFSGCEKLSSINGDLQIEKIEENVFSMCEKLENVKIEENRINKIERNAFKGCTHVNEIFKEDVCPRNARKELAIDCIKYGIPIVLKEGSESECTFVDGFGFQYIDKNELEFLKNYKTSTDVEMPDSCCKIFGNPFKNNEYLEKITISKEIEELPDGIFSGCKNLKEVIFKNKIIKVPNGAFCNCEKLASICFPEVEKNSIPSGIDIGEYAFCNCKSLDKLELPDDLKIIRKYTFKGCNNIKKIRCNEQLEKIETAGFSDFIGLQEIDLSSTKLKNIPKECFLNCWNLKNVKLPKELNIIAPFAFNSCQKLDKIDLYNTKLCYIGVAAFQDCHSLSEICIPEGIREIDKHCFKGCHNLKNVRLPNNLKSIQTSAFYKCVNLSEIQLPEAIEYIGTSAFSYTGLNRIRIPASLKELSKGMFEHSSNLVEVEIPLHITQIPSDCFKECGFFSIELPSNLEVISVGAFKYCYNLETITVPSSVKVIGASAFRSCVNLKGIEIPENIVEISNSVFEYCTSLNSIKLNNVTSIKRHAFKDCHSLIDIDLTHINLIDDSAFQNCYSLKQVNFSNDISTISTGAFMNCKSIEHIELPSSINKIYASSFRNMDQLKTVILPNVENLMICKSAFRDCINLWSVENRNNCELNVLPKAFKNCVKLLYFNIPSGSIIHVNSFENCPDENRIKELGNIEISEIDD